MRALYTLESHQEAALSKRLGAGLVREFMQRRGIKARSCAAPMLRQLVATTGRWLPESLGQFRAASPAPGLAVACIVGVRVTRQ